MKDQIAKLLKDILQEIGVPGVDVEIEIPDNPSHGDYSTSVALKLFASDKRKAKSDKWKSPMDIALQVKKLITYHLSLITHISHNQNITQQEQTISTKLASYSILQGIDRVEAVPPGFINFFLTEAKLSSQLERVINEREGYGKVSSIKRQASSRKKNMIPDTLTPDARAKRIMVEFTDPNPFKEFHVGHLYSNAVGESLSRLFEATGNEVRRADYFGDVGVHTAKCLFGILQAQSSKLKIQNFLEELEKKDLKDRVQVLGQAYAMGSKAFDEDKKAAEEIKALNSLIFIAAQELQTEKTGKKPILDYRKGRAIDEAKLADVKKHFAMGRQWSLEYFETIYKRLGTKFDAYYPESEVGEYGAKLVRDNVGKVFEESEGAIVFRGAHTRVFINQLGLPTYEAKELGLNAQKYQDWPFDQSYIVTGKEINEYFKVVLSAMEKLLPEVAKRTVHLGHGMVRLPTGKMSSRTGQILTAEWLIDEVKKAISNILQKSKSNYTKKDQEMIAEKAAIAAIKYSLLKVNLPSDIIFDITKSVSFEGDSGPYLQYTYARCQSVLRKAQSQKVFTGETRELLNISNAITFLTEEREVARLLMYFPEVVASATANVSPSMICTYLFTLAQAFNLFYAKHSILGIAKDDSKTSNTGNSRNTSDARILRLSLTAATAQVLKNGLYLLGIETLEKM